MLDLRTRRILAQIATGSGTEGIGLSPDDRHAYASSVYINEMVKFDTGTLQVVGRARMVNCLGAVRVVPTPVDGRTLVVNCADNGRVLLVEARTLNVTHEIPVGTLPIGIAVPDDRFDANMSDDTISVIDIRRGMSCVQFGWRRPRRHRLPSRLSRDRLLHDHARAVCRAGGNEVFRLGRREEREAQDGPRQ